MAINVSAANNQAAQLNDNISRLRDAKRQMQAYRSSVSNNWQGKEVTYILTAIDRVIGDIDSAIRNLDSLSDDIKSVATQIKREEDAAAAAARAAAERAAAERAAQQRAAQQRAAAARAEAERANQAKQQRINTAQSNYNKACSDLNALKSQKSKLERDLRNSNIFTRWGIQNQLDEVNKKIKTAESKVQSTYNALRAAKG